MEMAEDPLQAFWDALLSRQDERVREVFANLDKPGQIAVLDHLRRMCSEEGWHPEQIRSAQEALRVLGYGGESAAGTKSDRTGS
jgi:hypothetical protein